MNSATKYVARQLQALLGTYVDGVTEETLNLQLLGGKLKLENLHIRETAFAELELPVRASGRVGKLELSVNLLRFWWNEPVIIGLEDVDIELEPLPQGPELDVNDFDSHFERIRKWKEAQIRAIHEKQEPSQRSGDGFLARLAKKVRDSLEIRIRNFNICYTDRRSTQPEEAVIFCLGVRSLVSLASNSKTAQQATAGGGTGGSEEDGESGSGAHKEENSRTKKLLKAEGLYFYMAPATGPGAPAPDPSLSPCSAEYRQAFVDYMIVRGVNVASELVIHDNHQFRQPELHLHLDVEPLEWRFLRRQYILLYKMIEEASAYRSRLEHWHWRPRQPPMREPLRWLQYAARCVREQVHRRRFAARHGEAYVRAHRAHLLGQQSPQERAEMLRLERHMGAESLATLRAVAQASAAAHEAAAADAKREAARQQSWGQWARSFVKSTTPDGVDAASAASLDEESRRILDEALQQTLASSGDGPLEANAFPRDYGRYRFDFRASMGSLVLADGGWAGTGRALEEICYMRIDMLDGFYEIRRDTYRYCFDIEAFRMENRQAAAESLVSMAYSLPGGHVPGSTAERSAVFGSAIGTAEADTAVTGNVRGDDTAKKEKNGRRKLLHWSFDTLPQTDRDSDGGQIKVVIDGLNLVYSWKQLVLGVYSFWFVPKSERFPVHPAGRGDEDAASGRSLLERWTDRTRFDKSMQWEVEVLQPCVALPADAGSETEPVVVLALDRLRWFSDPWDWLESRKAVDPTAQYYDRNTMRLEGVRLCVSDNLPAWRRCCAAKEASRGAVVSAGSDMPLSEALGALREMTIAEDFGLEFTWDLCRLTDEVRDAMAFARHKAAVSVEEIHFACTAEQYSLFWHAFFSIIRSHYETSAPQAVEAAAAMVRERQEEQPSPAAVRTIGSPSVLFDLDIGDMRLDMLAPGEERSKHGFARLHFGGWAFHYENGHRARFQMRMRQLRLDDTCLNSGGLCFAQSEDVDSKRRSATSKDTAEAGRTAETNNSGESNFVIIERGWNDPALVDHPGFDHWWNFEFSILSVNWNNRTVRALTGFVDEAYRERPKSASPQPVAEPPADGGGASEASGTVEVASPAPAPRPRLQITASMHRLNAALMSDGCTVVVVAMTNAQFKYSRNPGKSITTGKVGDFVVEDVLGPEGMFRQKMGLRDKTRSVVEFEYWTYEAGDANYPGHDSWLTLEMSSTRLVYSRRFGEAIKAYLASEPLMSGLMGKTASAVAKSAKRAAGQHREGQGLTKVRCRLVNPLVVLPVDELKSDEYLVADLGEIILENRFEFVEDGDRMEYFDVKVQSMNLQDLGKEFLMEKVDLSFKGHRSLTGHSESHTAQQMNVACEVSDVRLVCSDVQLVRVRRTVATFASNGSDDSKGADVAAEDAQYLSANEDEAEFDDEFVDASDSEPWLRRVDVRFALRCTWLSMLCRMSDSAGDCQDLLRLSIQNVDTEYGQLNQAVDFAVKVLSINMHDISSGPSAEVQLLCSQSDPGVANQYVLSVKYTSFGPEGTCGERQYDELWDLDFHTLLLTWDAQTVATVMQFGHAAYGGEFMVEQKVDRLSEDHSRIPPLRSMSHSSSDASPPPPARRRLKVSASVRMFGATFMRERRSICSIAMGDGTWRYERSTAGTCTVGRLGDFVVEDLLGPEGSFREKLGLRDKTRSVVEFEYWTYESGDDKYPGYDAWLTLEMSSTRLVYSRRFGAALRDYLLSEPLMSGLMGKTASAVAESAKRAAGQHREGQGLTKVRCRLVNPLVVLPVDELKSDEYLIADLGEILLENRFDEKVSGSESGNFGRAERFEARIRSMNLQDCMQFFVLENVDIGLSGHRGLPGTATDASVDCALELSTTVSDVVMNASDQQLRLIMRLADQILNTHAAEGVDINDGGRTHPLARVSRTSAVAPSSAGRSASSPMASFSSPLMSPALAPVSTTGTLSSARPTRPMRGEISVGNVELRLFRSGGGGRDASRRVIVAVRLVQLGASYAVEGFASHSVLRLGALEVEDRVCGEARFLVSSQSEALVRPADVATVHTQQVSSPAKASGPGQSNEHGRDVQRLLVVEYEAVRPDAPEDRGFDSRWELRFHSLLLNWNDQVVALLVAFARDICGNQVNSAIVKQPAAGDSTKNERESKSTAKTVLLPAKQSVGVDEANGSALDPPTPAPRRRTQLTMSMQMLSAILMQNGDPIARVAMTAATLAYRRDRAQTSMTGKLGNFVVEDMLGPEGMFREKLGLRDKTRSVVEFEYRTYETGDANYPGHDAWLTLEMSSTRLVYSRRFGESLQTYLASEPLMSGLMGKTASAVAQSAKRAAGQHREGQGLTKVHFRLVNPLVVLPVDELKGDKYLVADLGEILVENCFESTGSEGRLEHFEGRIRSMNLQDCIGEYLMESVDIGLRGHRSLFHVPKGDHVDSNLQNVGISDPTVVKTSRAVAGGALKCELEVSDISAHVLPRQVVLLSDVIMGNLMQPLFDSANQNSPDLTEEFSAAQHDECIIACEDSDASGRPPSGAAMSGSPPLASGTRTEVAATVDVLLCMSRMELIFLESAGDRGSSRQHSCFSLLRPSMVLRRRYGEMSLIFSISRLGISHGPESNDPLGLPPRPLLRYYEPEDGDTPPPGMTSEANSPSSTTPQSIAVSPKYETLSPPTAGRERMPQLRLEYSRPADASKAAHIQVFLFRPEIVLLPHSLVDIYNYFLGIGELLAGRLERGRLYAVLQSPTKRLKRQDRSDSFGADIKHNTSTEDAARPTASRQDARRGPSTSVVIEVRKPRISFLEGRTIGGAGEAKVVVQSTIVARGYIDSASVGFNLTGCSLASAQMFVSEDGSDTHMRSLVDPFDLVVEYARPDPATAAAAATASNGFDPEGLGRLTVATSSNVEAQVSYNDCTFALALIHSWRTALAVRRQGHAAASALEWSAGGVAAAAGDGAQEYRWDASGRPAVAPPTMTCEFRSGSIGVVLINDCFSNSHMPVLEVRGSSLSAFYGPVDGAGSIVLKVDATLEIDYFNMEVAAWEPFLEHWPVRVILQTLPGAPVEWNFSATEPGNFNLTQAFAQCVALNRRTFVKALQAFEDADASAPATDPASGGISEDTKSSSATATGAAAPRARKITLLHPFHIRNETGVRVECSSIGAAAVASGDAIPCMDADSGPPAQGNSASERVSAAAAAAAAGAAAGYFRAVVEPGECVPLDIRSSRRTQRKRLAQSQSMLLRVGDAWRPLAVRIDRVGSQNLALKPLDETRGVPCKVVCEVALVEGSRHILLRSSVQVVNRTLRVFSLLLEPDGILPADGSGFDLPAEATSPIPVQMVAHCSLRIQPGAGRGWSQAVRLRHIPRDAEGRPTAQYVLYRHIPPDPSDEYQDVGANGDDPTTSLNAPFFAWIRMESADGFRLEVTVTPIVTLHNELASALTYLVVDGGHHGGQQSEARGRIPGGGRAEFHHFSPDEAAHLSILIPGFRPSALPTTPRTARGELARIQPDRAINSEAELHTQLVCRDESRDDLALLVTVANVVAAPAGRPGSGTTAGGRDRHVTLSCPFWIKNVTGLPLSFCLGSFHPGAEHDLVPTLPVALPEVVQQVHQQLSSTVTSSLGLPRMTSVRESFAGMTSSALSLVTPRGGGGSATGGGAHGGAHGGGGQLIGRGGREPEAQIAGQAAFHRAEQELGTLAEGLTERPLRTAAETAAAAAAERDYPSLMFSFAPRVRRALLVRVTGSQWSRELPVSDGGASGVVEVSSPATGAVFQLSLTRETRSSPYHRTEVLVFRPRFVLVNLAPSAVAYRQAGTPEAHAVRLHSRHRTNFHWTDGATSAADRALCILLLGDADGLAAGQGSHGGHGGEWGWSGGIDITALGDTHVRLRSLRTAAEQDAGATPAHRIVRVEVRGMSDTLYVIIHPEAPAHPPYRLENMSSYALRVRQADPDPESPSGNGAGAHGATDLIKPGECIPFAWDQPLHPPRLVVEVAGLGTTAVYDLDAIRDHAPMRIGGDVLEVAVAAEGPVKVFRVTGHETGAYRFESGPPHLHSDAAAGGGEPPNAAAAAAAHQKKRTPRELSVTVTLDTVSVTAADLQPRELATVHLDGVRVRMLRVCSGPEDLRTLECRIAEVQVDNMLHRTPYPVLLRSSAPTGPERPFIQADLVEDLGDAAKDGVCIIKALRVALIDTELCLEGRITLLLYLYELAVHGLLASGEVGPPPSEAELFESSAARRRRFYFESLLLPEVNVDFSFGRRELAAGDDPRAAAAAQRLAWLAASVDHAQLTLKELRTGHVFVDLDTLGRVLLAHYQSECRRQLLRVLGSVEILGNPVGLVRNLGTGFRALRSGIQETVRGDSSGDPSMRPAVDGAKTMLKHGTHGLSNTISKVSSSMSRGVAALAFDEEFLKERETAKDDKGRSLSVRVGAAAGTDNIKRAIHSGMMGLLRKPMEGYSTGGVRGMAAGVGLGVAGAICKPASGLLDLIANTTEGLSVQTNPTGRSWGQQVSRRREPRDLESDRVLRPLHAIAPHLHSDLLRRLARQYVRLTTEGTPSTGGVGAGAAGKTGGSSNKTGPADGLYGEDLQKDSYRSHVSLPRGVLVLTDRHCVYASDRPHPERSLAPASGAGGGNCSPEAALAPAAMPAPTSAWELGWNASLDAALVHRCTLEWHVLLGDVGNIVVAGGDVVLQASPDACAGWDVVIVPGCGPLAEEVRQVLDGACRRQPSAPPSRPLSRASSLQ